jgi:hypothetical protein
VEGPERYGRLLRQMSGKQVVMRRSAHNQIEMHDYYGPSTAGRAPSDVHSEIN